MVEHLGTKPRLLIFDWDGTLMDSERQIVLCMQRAAASLELVVPTDSAVRAIIGLGLPEAILALFPQHEKPLRDAIKNAYAAQFVAEAAGRSELFSGARELLLQLRQQGYLLAVATGKSRAGLNRVLAQVGWQRFFDATRCADETVSKPHPAMLHAILAELAVPAADAIMIGDTSFDVEMAARAPMRSIGVDYGAHERAALLPHRPVAIASSIVGLAECLASF